MGYNEAFGLRLASFVAGEIVDDDEATFEVRGYNGTWHVIPAAFYVLEHQTGTVHLVSKDSAGNIHNLTQYSQFDASYTRYDPVTLSSTPHVHEAQTVDYLGFAPEFGDARTGKANLASYQSLYVKSLSIGKVLKSDNYVPDTSGWRMRRTGDLEANNIIARGTIYASAGQIAHWDIGVVDAYTLSADSGKVKLNAQTPSISLGAAVVGYMTTGSIGFWVGKHSGAWKFHLGDPANDVLYWDGSHLYDSGNMIGGTVGGLTDGWKVKAGYIESKNANVRIDANSQYIGIGNPAPTSYGNTVGAWMGYNSGAKLSLYSDGNNYFQWNGSVLTWKGANTTLDASGNLTATSATLSGTITASAGAIGGWTIGASTLTGGNAVLNSTGHLTLGTSNDIVRLDATDSTYRLWIGNATAASATFRVTKGGALTASSAVISGSITATAGEISGNLLVTGTLQSSASANTGYKLSSTGLRTWNSSNTQTAQILADGSGWLGASTTFAWTTAGALTLGGFSAGADYLRDAADTFGLASTVTVGDDVRFWAGAAFASRASAPLQIYESGYIFAKDIVLAKGQLSGASGATGYGYAVGDPLLLLHFDGAKPFETDYFGSLIGHKGQAGTYTWGGTQGKGAFRPGKFNKALQIAEATTNLIANPSWETNQTGWSVLSGTFATNSRVTTNSYFGSYSNKLVNSSGSNAILSHSWTANASISTISIWVYREAGAGAITLYLQENFAPFTAIASVAASATTGVWQRLVVSGATTSTSSYRLRVDVATGVTCYLDGAQAEGKSSVTPYCDGSLGLSAPTGTASESGVAVNGHSWSGTNHASTSSRTASVLSYPASGNINLAQGTILLWYYNTGSSGNFAKLFGARIDANNYLNINATASGTFTPYADSASGGVSAGTSSGAATASIGWNLIAVTWTAGALSLSLNGVLSGATANYVIPAGTLSTMEIGSFNGANFANTLIDEVCVLDHVLSLNEIKSIYYSEAPLMIGVSNQEFRLSGPGLGDVFGNANGLFGRDADGKPSFGIINGTVNATTWGGASETFTSGDTIFGSNLSGYGNMLFDTSDTGIYIRVGITKKFQVAWDVLKYGSDVSAAATTALAIFNSNQTYNFESVETSDLLIGDNSSSKANILWDKSAGQLKLRSGTTTTLYLDTAGSLNFGSGNQKLDANGLTIAIDESFSLSRAISWKDGADVVTSLWMEGSLALGYEDLHIDVASPASRDANIRLTATPGSGAADASIVLNAGGTTYTFSALQSAVFNQGGIDTSILEFHNTDVGHGMTGIANTKAFGVFGKVDGSAGGLEIAGLRDADAAAGNALRLRGYLGETADTTKSTSGNGVISVSGSVKSGTSATTVGANGNVFAVLNHNTTVAIVDAEGDLHLDASSNPNAWDDYDDIALIESYRTLTAGPDFRHRLALNIEEHVNILARTRVITLNADGHHFASVKGLFGLGFDAMRQIDKRLRAVEAALGCRTES